MSTLLILAQQQQQPSNADAAAAIAAFLFVIGVMLVVLFGVYIVICALLYMCQSKVPPEHQKIAPGMIYAMRLILQR